MIGPMRKVFLVGWALAVSMAAARAETWFTIVSDRGCIISSASPLQFQQAMLAQQHIISRQERKYWPNGTLMGVDVVNTDATGERNQWFFLDPQTCLAAAKIMGVAQN